MDRGRLDRGRRDGRRPDRRRRGWGLFGWYALASALPVVLLGVGLARMYTSELDQRAMKEAVLHGDAIANAGLEPLLAGRPVDASLPAETRAALAATTGPLLDSGSVLRLRVRDVQGHVIFDAQHPERAPYGGVDDEAEEAARGQVVRKLTRMNADTVDRKAGIGVRAVEAYLPLHAPGSERQVIGVEEIYLPYAPIAASLRASQHRMIEIIALGLTGLWGLLGAITWSVTRRLRRSAAVNEHLALHDTLTGLPNRRLFTDRVQHAVAGGRRSGEPVAIAVLDLDRFKEVNDTLGHDNGDDFLRHIANRLTEVLRPGDTVARLGGDEFGLVLPGLDRDAARAVLERVRDAVAEEIELDGVPVSVEVTVGSASWPLDALDAESLLQCADLALHAATTAHAGILEYDEGLEHFSPTRLALVARLRRAIVEHELVLHYQPKLDLVHGHVAGVEALVRWNHPERGLLAPGEFLDVAESTGLIAPLTEWVVGAAVEQIAAWKAAGIIVTVAVNVSARNLRDESLPDLVFDRLGQAGVDATSLQIEITETAVVADPVRAAAVLRRLAEGGVRVSIDDFGQGYTSLAHLGRLPVAELKIDRQFVAGMDGSEEDFAIVRTVVELGHQLGLVVVAEGVESQHALAELATLGCDLVQGYLLTPALPADAAARWIREHEQESRVPVIPILR